MQADSVSILMNSGAFAVFAGIHQNLRARHEMEVEIPDLRLEY
jgi:hypothetical protein